MTPCPYQRRGGNPRPISIHLVDCGINAGVQGGWKPAVYAHVQFSNGQGTAVLAHPLCETYSTHTATCMSAPFRCVMSLQGFCPRACGFVGAICQSCVIKCSSLVSAHCC